MKYQLPYGRFIPESEVSNHHVNWRRKDYKSALDKAYRSNLILPLHNKVHTELHQELYPPPNNIVTIRPKRTTLMNGF